MNGSTIGVPREIRASEGRIALTPQAVAVLVEQGRHVIVESGGGLGSGFSDAEYLRAGAEIAEDAATLFGKAELIVKVKEPQRSELPLLQSHHRLFCFLHLAADLELMEALRRIGLTAIAFETVEVEGRLPLLTPMSQIAGKLSVQMGAQLLQQTEGGKGILLGGVDGMVDQGHVVVLGGGNAGRAAISVAAALGAEVTVLVRNVKKYEPLASLGKCVNIVRSTAEEIAHQVARADLLVGAVLIKGDRAPKLVTREMVGRMEPGSVVIDISVDQGGCIETIRPTNYKNPTYSVGGVTHFGVTNMPGAVPKTAAQALSAAILPWVKLLALPTWEDDKTLRAGVNVAEGEVRYPVLQSMQ